MGIVTACRKSLFCLRSRLLKFVFCHGSPGAKNTAIHTSVLATAYALCLTRAVCILSQTKCVRNGQSPFQWIVSSEKSLRDFFDVLKHDTIKVPCFALCRNILFQIPEKAHRSADNSNYCTDIDQSDIKLIFGNDAACVGVCVGCDVSEEFRLLAYVAHDI